MIYTALNQKHIFTEKKLMTYVLHCYPIENSKKELITFDVIYNSARITAYQASSLLIKL